jgi:hypothetical protein
MSEKIREDLYKHIEMFGTSDERTIKKSQELDIALNIEFRQKKMCS